MRQHFILADQRGGGDLRHHKSRIEAGASGEKRRQAFIQRWIDEALKPPLGNSRERAERDAKEIEHERYGLAVEISRSEEHTSELQSRLHLVCRLLLEKKK